MMNRKQIRESKKLEKDIMSRHIRFRLPRRQLPYRPKDFQPSDKPYRAERVCKRLFLWKKLVMQFGETMKPHLP